MLGRDAGIRIALVFLLPGSHDERKVSLSVRKDLSDTIYDGLDDLPVCSGTHTKRKSHRQRTKGNAWSGEG